MTGKTATPEIAQGARVHQGLLDVPVLYGGSGRPDNAAELLLADVDGALVGGAWLDVESFAAICPAATRS